MAFTGLALIGIIALLWLAHVRKQTGLTLGARAAIRVTADELERAYDANEVAADERFRGKLLRVRGVVDSINKDFLDEPKVLLDTRRMIGVLCAFEEGWSKQLAGLRKGDEIVVRCLGKGMAVTIPMLERCSLESIQR